MIWNCLAVGIGGAMGAICRYLLGSITYKPENGFPMATFIINIVGAFFIGAIVAVSAKKTNMDPRVVLFFKVGLCGGFTTFSSFSLETMDLLQNGKILLGGSYAILSVILGIIAVYFGQLLFR